MAYRRRSVRKRSPLVDQPFSRNPLICRENVFLNSICLGIVESKNDIGGRRATGFGHHGGTCRNNDSRNGYRGDILVFANSVNERTGTQVEENAAQQPPMWLEIDPLYDTATVSVQRFLTVDSVRRWQAAPQDPDLGSLIFWGPSGTWLGDGAL
jgi:hypothetical protein